MKFLSLAFHLFTAVVLFSQPSIEISNPSKLPGKTGKFKLIGKNSDGIILRLYGGKDVIDVFDKNLKLSDSRNIDFKDQAGLSQYVMLNKTGAVIFYLQQNRKYSVLFAQPVNSSFLEIGKPILIDSILDRKELVAANLRFKPSVDQSSLLIYYPFFSIGKVDVIKFICLDRGLKTLYNKIIPVSRDERQLENSKALVDNNGSAFLILQTEDGQNGNRYEVLHMSNDGEFNNYNINTSMQLFRDPWFEIDNKNGNLVLTALYDDNTRAGEELASGFLYSSYDPANGTMVKNNYTPFSKEFIAELTGRENVTNQSLYTFNIRKSILRNDGGALILAESFIHDSRETPIGISMQPGYNSYRTSEVFQFNDMIAFSVNPNGDLEWSTVMRKKQVSEDDNGVYSSFLIMNEKDKLRLIYLDDVSTSGELNQYILSSTGKNSREVIMAQESNDLMLIPKMGAQVSPNEVVIPSYKSGALQLVKITF